MCGEFVEEFVLQLLFKRPFTKCMKFNFTPHICMFLDALTAVKTIKLYYIYLQGNLVFKGLFCILSDIGTLFVAIFVFCRIDFKKYVHKNLVSQATICYKMTSVW